jgi:hypothetical protein
MVDDQEVSGTTTKKSHPLLRDPAAGINPVTLLTGFFGPRGERIRHQVHEGALRLPQGALDIYETTEHKGNVSAEEEYILPGLDSVLRPSLDSGMSTYGVSVSNINCDDLSFAFAS